MLGRSYHRAPGATVYLETGLFLSNTWIGRSQVYGKVFDARTLGGGDVIMDLPGGRFVQLVDRDGLIYRARFSAEERHPFSRGCATRDLLPDGAIPCDPVEWDATALAPVAEYPQHLAFSWPRFGAMDVLRPADYLIPAPKVDG